MKRVLIAVAGICILAIAANAAEADKKQHKPSEAQKALRKEMLGKYDSNNDGKLDKAERAKMTSEDKAKMKEHSPKKKGK